LLLGDFGLGRREVGFGLIDGMLIVGMVDLDKQLIGFDVISLVHVNFGDVAIHAGEEIYDLVGDDVGRVGQADGEVLFQREGRSHGDDASLLVVGFGAAAQTEHHQGRDGEENDHAENDEGVLLQRLHIRVLNFLARLV